MHAAWSDTQCYCVVLQELALEDAFALPKSWE